MNKMKEFNKVLFSLEINKDEESLKKLRDFMKESHIYLPLFRHHIRQRLDNNIHPQQLINLRKNTSEIDGIGNDVNEVVVKTVINDSSSYDQFYFMYRHEDNKENSIRDEFIKQLWSYNQEHIMSVLNIVASQINIDKINLLLQMLEYRYSDAPVYYRIRMLEGFELNIQYEIVVRSLNFSSSVFPSLIRTITDSKLGSFISNRLTENGDDDPFAMAIRASTFDISIFATHLPLTGLLTQHADKIPRTLDSLAYRAEVAQLWDYVLLVGINQNKKDLLRKIIKSKRQDLIDQFFFMYKNDPSVKHLTPFI